MTFKFTPDQINQITVLFNDAVNGVSPFSDVYDEIFSIISLPVANLDDAEPGVDFEGNAPDASVWLWFAGARKINASTTLAN